MLFIAKIFGPGKIATVATPPPVFWEIDPRGDFFNNDWQGMTV
jgi:hypothetical protein